MSARTARRLGLRGADQSAALDKQAGSTDTPFLCAFDSHPKILLAYLPAAWIFRASHFETGSTAADAAAKFRSIKMAAKPTVQCNVMRILPPSYFAHQVLVRIPTTMLRVSFQHCVVFRQEPLPVPRHRDAQHQERNGGAHSRARAALLQESHVAKRTRPSRRYGVN